MEKSPPELIERFDAVAVDFPEATRRLTFGYPCLYVGGNMVSGLFESRWHVKLGLEERRELEAIPGSTPFEPMPGRPMTGFTLLPTSIVDDDVAIRQWVRRAIAYGTTLPPKLPKAKSTSKKAEDAEAPRPCGRQDRGAEDRARRVTSPDGQPIAAGWMFWFIRKRLDGS